MNKTIAASILVLVFIGGLVIFYNPKSVSGPIEDNSLISDIQQNWESKTDEQANVVVIITPIDISPQAKEWRFNIVMDTHSVELDQDLTKFAVLIDNRGKEYKPINWEGSVGGHHREGVLTFNQIIPTPESVELKISNIGGIVRSFTWQLK
ncbi:MAG: hypothetical protein WBL19_00725 [Minisyncoccia bacterium]